MDTDRQSLLEKKLAEAVAKASEGLKPIFKTVQTRAHRKTTKTRSKGIINEGGKFCCPMTFSVVAETVFI